jgi:hypothetical protein
MKQITSFILLLSLFVYSSTGPGSDCEHTEASKSNCKTYTNLNAKEKEEGDSCCYVTGKVLGIKVESCQIIHKEDVDEAIKQAKDSGIESASIVCSSNWIRFGLSLILLVLLL